MKCSRAQKYISEYVDGLLNPKQEASLRRHIEECSDCRGMLEDFQAAIQEAKDLTRPVPSDRVLENALIRFRDERGAGHVRDLGAKQVSGPLLSLFRFDRWPGRLVASAAVLATAVILLMTVGIPHYHPWSYRSSRSSQELERAAIDQLTLMKLDEAQRHYEQAIKALSDATIAQNGNLDTEVKRVFQANLALVEKSIQDCRQAVKRDPRNMEAQNALMASYNDKVELMTELIAAESSSEVAGASRSGGTPGSEEKPMIGL